MSEFTLLPTKNNHGHLLDVLNKYGLKCTITDFGILLGGHTINSLYTSDNIQGTTNWWTKSRSGNVVCTVNEHGYFDELRADERSLGFRPLIPYSTISRQVINQNYANNILEVEYGEYPQDAASVKLSAELEELYQINALLPTGKTYTTDLLDTNDNDRNFKATKHLEFQYEDERYIRIVPDYHCIYTRYLSNGQIIGRQTPYWIEVKPIKWLVDEQNDVAIAKKALFSGIRFNNDVKYDGDFSKTEIKKFLDNYFSKDIITSQVKNISEELTEYSADPRYLHKQRNSYDFNLSEVTEEDIIKGAIESNIAVFLHGRSSEGKSARIKELDPNCIIIYLRNATPESLNGKSVYNQATGELIDIKPIWLKKLEDICLKEPDKYHIVFFDEITNAMLSIQGMAFNIILDKEVNGIWKLPENARIVAAGNDIKDSLAANQLAEPFFNRFAHVYIETTPESWLKWASTHHIHPAIYSYIAYKRGIPLRSKYTGEKPNADPRKWEMASKILYTTRNPEMLRALLGEDITKEFCQFCSQYVITLEDVLKDNYTEEDLQMNTSEIYATISGLSQVDETNFEKVRNFVLKLGAEPCAVFESIWTHDDESRLEIVAETKLTNEKGVKKIYEQK